MKTLLAVSLALAFISCANAQSNNGTSAAALGPRTGPAYYSPPNSPYRKWTTKQLQQRRLDLYRQIPQRQTNLPGHRGEPYSFTTKAKANPTSKRRSMRSKPS